MSKFLQSLLPPWAQPRAPLVAISLRTGGMWDYRFSRFARQVLNIFINFWFLPILFFPATLIFLALADTPLIITLTYMILLVLAPIVGFTTEILYNRIWLAMPYRTSAMIAGETERQTWDIFRSIPYPRHQLVLGKLAALWWLTETSLIYITLIRTVFLGGLIAVRAMQNGVPLAEAIFNWGLWWLILAIMPLLEAYALAGLGLFISAVAESSRQASLIGMTGQLLYRVFSVSLFLALVPSFETVWVMPGLIFPQWTFSPLLTESVFSTKFVLSMVFAFGILPVTVGSLALWATIRAVDGD